MALLSREEMIEFCSNPSLVNYVCLMVRPGLRAWLVELEYTKFKPDTPANDGFHLSYTKWPDIDPIPQLTITIATFDKSGKEFADSILWKHGLKKCKDGFTLITIDRNGPHNFFLQGPNVFILENHSKGASNVVYTNDPKKIKIADEHEKQQCQKFFDEHTAWLATPEGKSISDEYWKDKPTGLSI